MIDRTPEIVQYCAYRSDTTPELKHFALLCANLGKQVRTPDGEGVLKQAFSDRIAVALDSDPKKLRFYANIFDVAPVENPKA
jgi:hypothetical protein